MNEPSLFPLPDLLASVGDEQGEIFGDSFALRIEPLEGAEIHVIAFRGLEEMSALYAFDVLFWVSGLDEIDLADACLARRAQLSIPTPAGPRTVHGIATAVELVSTHRERRAYRLRIAPRAWLLSKTTDTRVFQDMTVPHVIGEVLREHGVAYVLSLAAPYAPRRYCLQYEETDLAFVTRLAAEEGIFFCFDQLATDDEARQAGVERAGERMIFGDTKALYAPIAGSPLLAYAPDAAGALAQKENQVHSFRSASNIASNVATVRGYDYTLASRRGVDAGEPGATNLVHGVVQAAHATAPGAAGELEVYDHHDDYEDIGVTRAVARTRLEQLRASAIEGSGITWCRRLSPGRSFRLVDHEVPSLDREYAVTRVRHEGNARRAEGVPVYRCDFSCVPAEVPFRPARPPRRVHQAVETGQVVGPESEEIETERYGCVRVQFHWDRRGRHDEHSSCWIRVMQPWAGIQYGFSFVPRIGMEVLVSFIGGDVDRPVVIGCMPNQGNAPPMALPQDKTQSAIRSQSTPGGGGFNEILFEDKAGGELLGLRAQRNLQEVVLRDRITQIGAEQETDVGGGRTDRIGKNDSVVVGGDRSRTVEGSCTEEVKGDTRLDHYGSRSLYVAGDDTERVIGRRTVTVFKSMMTVVGRPGEQNDCLVFVTGTYRVNAAQGIEIHSPGSIRLWCGPSSIEIGPEGITLDAPRVTLLGGEAIEAKVKSSELRMGVDAVEVLSKAIKARSEGAAVVLDAAAKVSPAWATGAKGPDGKDRPDRPPVPGVAKFKVEPPPGQEGPFVLRIATPSGEVVERTTDANLEVHMDGVEGDKFVLVEVLRGEHSLHHTNKDP